MTKKRVGVTLRKPPQAPEGVVVPPEPVETGRAGSEALKPPPEAAALNSATMEAFVNGAAAALEKVASEIPMGRLRELLKRGFDGYRELTVYLPEKLAQDLSLHCLRNDLDMNRFVASALEQQLGAPKALCEPGVAGATRLLIDELARWAKSAVEARVRRLWPGGDHAPAAAAAT